MDFEKISSYDFMIKVFAKYHRQLLKELDKEYRRRDDIDPPADDIIRQHLAEYHSRCPVCVVDDDPPTRLSGTMEPSAPWKVGEPAITIVLKEDGPDSMFVEIETDDGASACIGTRYDCDSFTRLRITADEIISACRNHYRTQSQPEPCKHDLFNSCEECYMDGQREPEMCECDLVASNRQWLADRAAKFCPWCGLPLQADKED